MSERKPLTPKQLDVMILRCGEDLCVEATADRLGISRKTVIGHTSRAFRRLGARHIGGACFRLRGRAEQIMRDGKRVA
jgi:DNA-binding CsgD family transcriptional regulator